MKAKKRGNWFAGAAAALMGLLCALVLGFVFYGAMAYQLLDEEGTATAAVQAPPDARLFLAGGRMLSEQTVLSEYGGEECTAVVRVYELEGGGRAEAITAQPAAYIERLSQEGYEPQLITGFVLAGMDAVYALSGEDSLLCARQDDRIFMIRTKADEQAVYALGAGAYLE